MCVCFQFIDNMIQDCCLHKLPNCTVEVIQGKLKNNLFLFIILKVAEEVEKKHKQTSDVVEFFIEKWGYF